MNSTTAPRRLRGAEAEMEREDTLLSTFDCRETGTIVLSDEEAAILEATKSYADAGDALVQVLTKTLGDDRTAWHGKNSKLKNVKPFLRDWWIDKHWRVGKQNAAVILKCSDGAVVEAMKREIQKPSTKEEEADDIELFNLKNRIRKQVNWFLDKTVFAQAKALKQVRSAISVPGIFLLNTCFFKLF